MSLHKPRAIYGNILFNISYGFNFYLLLLCLQFLSKTHLNVSKIHFWHHHRLSERLWKIPCSVNTKCFQRDSVTSKCFLKHCGNIHAQ
jgi:hypothetical protein